MFSVVIPLYNKELSIKNTIQSVLEQSYQDFEVVVVNDGSTDNSVQVVESVDDERICLIHQANQGVSAARNRGIQEASREWIAFLDADDLWASDHLQEINMMLQKFPEEKIFVTSFEFSDKRPMFKQSHREVIYKIENYFKEAMKESLMWTSIVVVHKSCIDKVGGFNEALNLGEDLDLWARLAREYKMVKSQNVTAVYRVDAENRSSLSKNVQSTHVFHYDLSSISDPDENNYYKYSILKMLYAYSRSLSFINVIRLKNKHSKINWLEYFLFSLKVAVRSVSRKFLVKIKPFPKRRVWK